MSGYVFMKMLESAPQRYDAGIRLLTLGRLDSAYDRLVTSVREGFRVLDIGCGTGALTLRAARRGATVMGIDINAQMLEIARNRAEKAGLTDRIEFHEMGVAELGELEKQSFDVVMSGLCFSELTPDELTFALDQTSRLLRTGGTLLLADETLPKGFFFRAVNTLVRLPLALITYLVTQTTTRAVRHLEEKVKLEGLTIESVRKSRIGDFTELVARKPGPDTAALTESDRQ